MESFSNFFFQMLGQQSGRKSTKQPQIIILNFTTDQLRAQQQIAKVIFGKAMIVSQYNNRKQWYFENIISKNSENGNHCVSIEAPFHFETLLSLIYSLIYFGAA